jgi:uncharacterized protein YyaL (SSP411 family)
MQKSKIKENAIDLTSKWLLDSGIQADSGGFYAWYDLDKKLYPFLYSEITGYGITTLLFMNKVFDNSIFIDKAKKAASWIEKYALHPCGGVMARLYKDDVTADNMYSFRGENIFSFDTGMVLYGLVNLYRLTHEEKFFQISKIIANFLINKMQNNDGSLTPIYNAGKNKMIEYQDKWSNQRGSFHAKVALGLVDLFELTRDSKYQEAVIKLCSYALLHQEDSGRFITDTATKNTNLHPHCYSAEGILYAGIYFKIPTFIEQARKATEWIFSNASDKGINELYEPSVGFGQSQRSDVLAQVLRLGLLFCIDEDTLKRLKARLLEYQYLGDNESQNGGFLYSKNSLHLNSWCSMFALQALQLYHNRGLVEKGKRLDLFI